MTLKLISDVVMWVLASLSAIAGLYVLVTNQSKPASGIVLLLVAACIVTYRFLPVRR
jgi:hypothetical protein